MNVKITFESLEKIKEQIQELQNTELVEHDDDLSRLVDYFYMFQTAFESCVEKDLV